MTPKQQLDSFFAKYEPAMAALGRRVLAKLRKLTPGAVEMVYDSHNALVIGLSASERPSDAVLSIGLYTGWVNLYFLEGAILPDPHGLLRGKGNQVRSIRVEDAAVLDDPQVVSLIKVAVKMSDAPFDAKKKRTMVIRAVAKRQRPRKNI